MKKVIFCIFALLSTTIFADDIYIVIAKKNQQKKARGFNLLDWMHTKKRMVLMDQWLALNSSANLFETQIEGGKSDYEKTLDGSALLERKLDFYKGSFFLKIFGIEYAYEKSNEDFKSQVVNLSLRLLGTSQQTTRLNLEYGQKVWNFDEDDEYKNFFWGGTLNLNLLPFLGLMGSYKNFIPDASKYGMNVKGDEIVYGAFLDFMFARILVSQFEENLKIEDTVWESSKRSGQRLSVSIFF